MKWFLVWLFALASGLSSAGDLKSTVVADYSNITTSMKEDPHQSGYAVTIYKREDGLLYGDFTFATGTTEGVGARLFNLHFSDGSIAFSAKTSAYQTNNGPSKELFEFKGKIRHKVLIGTLTVWNGYDLSRPVSSKLVKLKKANTAMPLRYEVHQEIFKSDPW